MGRSGQGKEDLLMTATRVYEQQHHYTPLNSVSKLTGTSSTGISGAGTGGAASLVSSDVAGGGSVKMVGEEVHKGVFADGVYKEAKMFIENEAAYLSF